MGMMRLGPTHKKFCNVFGEVLTIVLHWFDNDIFSQFCIGGTSQKLADYISDWEKSKPGTMPTQQDLRLPAKRKRTKLSPLPP